MAFVLGDRNLRNVIDKAFDSLYEESRLNIDAANYGKIHVSEVSGCTRFSYYERKQPLPYDRAIKMARIAGSRRRQIDSGNADREYKVDNDLSLQTSADMLMGNEFVVMLKTVRELPEVPLPREMLELNACLFAFDKEDGLLIYITIEGKTVEFDITRSNRMLTEVLRRARVLSTLLKDDKVPLIEPSQICIGCKYYERCYSNAKVKESSGDLLGEIFGKRE